MNPLRMRADQVRMVQVCLHSATFDNGVRTIDKPRTRLYDDMEPSVASSAGPVFPDLAALFSQVSAASADQRGSRQHAAVHRPQAPTPPRQTLQHTTALGNNAGTHSVLHASASAHRQPAEADMRAEMEAQLQRAVLQMHVLNALQAGANPHMLGGAGFHAPLAGAPIVRSGAAFDGTATSHSGASCAEGGPKTHRSTSTTFDPLQWLQAAGLTHGSGASGNSTPESAPMFCAALPTPRSASCEVVDEAPCNAAHGERVAMAAAAREALAQVRAAALAARSASIYCIALLTCFTGMGIRDQLLSSAFEGCLCVGARIRRKQQGK